MSTRTVTWGDALLVRTVKYPGGLNQAVNRIRGALGPQIGVRNSFAKLYEINDPADLNDRDLWRAWLLLAAIQENPEEWGIDGSVIPGIHQDRVDTLNRLLAGKPKTSDYKSPVSLTTHPRGRLALRRGPANRSR